MPVVEALHMMGDLFWDVATSGAVLLAIGAIAIAAFVVAHVPFIRAIPAVAPYAVTASLVQVVAAGLLMFLVGFRIADERAETKQLKGELAWQTNQIAQQKASAEDAARLAEQKANEAEALKAKVDDYEATLAKQPIGTCALDDRDLGGLRALRARQHGRADPARLRGLGRNRAAP
jgi:hypothetical protein